MVTREDNNIMKRIISFLLTAILIIAVFALPVFASEPSNSIDTLQWEAGMLSDKGAVVNNNSYRRTSSFIDVSNYDVINTTFNSNGHFAYTLFFYNLNKNFLFKGTKGLSKNQSVDVSLVQYIKIHIYTNNGASYNWTNEDYNRLQLSGEKKEPSSGENSIESLLHFEKAYINHKTGIDAANSNWMKVNEFVPIGNISSLKIQRDSSPVIGRNIYFYNKDGAFLKSLYTPSSVPNSISQTYTDFPQDAAYVRFAFYCGSTTIQDVSDYSSHIHITLYSTVSNQIIDKSKTGSITIYDYALLQEKELYIKNIGEERDYSDYLNSIGARPLEGVSFEITRVVNETFQNGQNEIYYDKNGIILPSVDNVKNSLSKNDGVFTRYNTYNIGPTDQNGKATISNLPLGIYLVHEVSTTKPETEKISDYLVSVPMTSSNGESWNYNVVTYPKAINGYVLTYDANNGTSERWDEPRYSGKTEELTALSSVKALYNEKNNVSSSYVNGTKFFMGWADTKDAKLPDYYDMQDFTMPHSNKTIYAVWGYTSSIRYYTSFKYSEPWGLEMCVGLINPNTNKLIPYSNYDNYGIYVLPMHKSGTETPSLSEVIKKGKLYNNETPILNSNTDWSQGNINPENGDNISTNNNFFKTDYIGIDSNGLSLVNSDSNYKYNVYWYDANKGFLTAEEKEITPTSSDTKQFSTPTGAKFVRIVVYNAKGINVNLLNTDKAVLLVKQSSFSVKRGLIFNDGSVGDYLSLIYDEKIYTHNLNDDIYAVTYITYKGRTFWGTVKNRCVINSVNQIIESKQVGLSLYSDAEVQLATALKGMFDASYNYRQNYGYDILEEPKKPRSVTEYTKENPFSTIYDTKEFNYVTSMRAYEPWGLQLQAIEKSGENFENCDSYGCISYVDHNRQFSTLPTVEELLTDNNTVVYSNIDKTASIQNITLPDGTTKKCITCSHIGIESYRLAQTDVYTCFFYVKDGKNYFSDVRKRNAKQIADACYNQYKDSENERESLGAELYKAMITLYKETYFYRNGYYPTDSGASTNYYADDTRTPNYTMPSKG